MPLIDATSKEDIYLLAKCFLTIPQEDRWKVVARVNDLGLMRFRGAQFFVNLLKKWKGSVGVFQFFKIVSEKSPKAIDTWWEDTIRHIVNGKDTYDPASYGGWSQNEINLLLDSVSFTLLKDRSQINKGTENEV